MKKLAIAVRLFAIALAIGATACSKTDNAAAADAAATPAAEAAEATAGGGIRYINLDTVFANYT
ncbi:MAG: hypothetical protein K2F77_08695, partial [Muribaculaceae bacterium]|nr:hypothetical protein [Muribaculaceae bacterium]